MKLIREQDDFDWIRDTAPNFDENNTPGVGDVLVCLPGYHNSPSEPYNNEQEDPNCAGAGYAEGRIIVVKEVDISPNAPEGKRVIIWPDEDESQMYWDYDDGEVCFDCGIFGFALTYYTETLNESDDEWAWTKDPINPWLEYDGIIFDIEPRRDEVNEYIEMALRTRDDIVNKDSWTVGRENDINDIIKYQKEYNFCILGVDNTSFLTYGTSGGYYSNRRLVNYSQLIGVEPLMESEDPLQWIRDIQPPSFKDAVIGQEYDITTKPNLFKAIKACVDNENMYFSKRAKVIDKDNLPYNNIFCGHEREDIVPALLLEFLDEDGWNIAQFWVTEDMVQLH